MVTVSDAEGGPHEKEMDIDVHTEVDDDELDVSTSLDSKRALTKSRAVKVGTSPLTLHGYFLGIGIKSWKLLNLFG